MSETKNHPLAVYCSCCGAPAEFDIVHQEYHCQHCGGTTDIQEPVQRLGEWRSAQRKSILEGESTAEEVHACQNCGAQVLIPKGEAMGKCEFCGGKFARRAFAASELPEVIIPFVLTENEARERLKAWAESNQKEKEARAVLSELKNLRGYYLPYELIRGPVTAEAERMETCSDRKYHVGGFLNGIAVNTSKQLDNMVLDAMEPFEWTAARPFEFSFIAGQRVKLSDIDAKKTEERVLEEVAEGFRPDVEKALQTTGITLSMHAGNLLRLPALLPAYVLKVGKTLAVVNGQTGRVAVSKEKQERVLSWLIEPTIMTLLVSLLMWLWMPNPELVGMTAVVFGLIFFTAFSDGRGEEWRRVIFKTEKSRAERVQSKLTVTQGEDIIEDTTTKAIFLESVGGKTVPVRIAFYTPFRIIMTLLGVIIFNALPAICAYPLDTEGVANYAYNAVWMVATVPMTIIFWIAIGRIRIYNHPVLEMILPDGRTKSVKADGDLPLSLWGVIKSIKERAGWGAFLFIVGFLMFMFLGTLGAILMPD
ncbi:MAG: hypothetical protein IIZ54_07130 [Selenomonadaceae bacterium]|nr:hypothetical protein [Selenomonadaceae bacterium]